MQIFEIILIGLVLALDATAVTLANCTTYSNIKTRQEVTMAICFSVFQFLMPVLGFYIGSLFVDKLMGVSKYVCAGIFFVLATKIVIENIIEMKKEKDGKIQEETEKGKLTIGAVIIQGIATSIDALAIGVTFTLDLSYSIFTAGAIIGVVTFAMVYMAIFFGKYLKGAFADASKWIGAVILYIIAIKNLFF